MSELKPLKSSVGQPAEGESKYFPRDKIVKKVFRKLRSNENLLLSAPRRIGKSTILKYMVKNPEENQIIKYMIVQSVNTQEEFFKKLFNELLDKEIFDGLDGYFHKASAAVKSYASRIKGFNIGGSVQVGDEQIDYYEECLQLINSIKTSKQVIIFVDEFPDTLNNILDQDKNLAINFLQKNRDLRMKFSEKNLLFVYTGSTGLKNVVRKFDKLDLINDIHTIDVPPLSDEEAKELIERLILGFQNEIEEFSINNDTIEYILEKVTWKLPYYIQIILDELFNHYEDTEEKITNGTVDFIFSEIVKSKSSHADYFENWKGRLKKAFKGEDHNLAIEILNYIAKNDCIEHAIVHDMAVGHSVNDLKYVLDVLMHDGYISESEKVYGFNSILLKEWWYINVAV